MYKHLGPVRVRGSKYLFFFFYYYYFKLMLICGLSRSLFVTDDFKAFFHVMFDV